MKRFLSMPFILTFLLCLYPALKTDLAWSRPESIQVWFLSESPEGQTPVTQLWPLTINFSAHSAATDLNKIHQQCVPLGQQFFHPQLGPHYHEATDTVTPEPALGEKRSADTRSEKIKGTIYEDHLGRCDPNYFFDFYCGEERAVKKIAPTKLEVWIDVSSSFLRVDAPSANGCFRSQFVEKLQKSCGGQNVNVFLFDTQYSVMLAPSDACGTKGLNDTKRMIEWIEKSEAKSLVFITDISEYTAEFTQYLNKYAAKMVGSETRSPLSSKKMSELVPTLTNDCSP